MSHMMRAAVFKDIEQIVVEEMPVPSCPSGGLLIKVQRCGICGSDIRNYHHGLKDGITNQIMGHEIAGEIIETGGSIPSFHIGDRVALAPDVSCGVCWYCKRGLVNLCTSHKMLGTHYPGGYAQYMALPPEILSRGFIEHIPEGMSFSHAAFAETAAAVIACQARNNISLGDRVVIIGDGPVGCLHLEVARARGAARVIMVGMDKLELAETFHPDLLLSNRNPDEVKQKVLEATDGIGADFVILALPLAAPQQQAVEMVRKRGHIIIYGGVPKTASTTAIDSNMIHYNEITVTGAFSYPATGLADALSAIHTQKIHADRYIGPCVSLEHVVDGMKIATRGEALKVLIDPWL